MWYGVRHDVQIHCTPYRSAARDPPALSRPQFKSSVGERERERERPEKSERKKKGKRKRKKPQHFPDDAARRRRIARRRRRRSCCGGEASSLPSPPVAPR
jgi:predicted phage gp36 major capsid-like protein